MKRIELKKLFGWRNAFVLLLGVLTTFATYQHFWAKRISAQSTTTTRILIPWFSGDDANYSSLLYVVNTSMDPYGTTPVNGTCSVTAVYNGVSYGPGSLGTIAPGTVNSSLELFTSSQIQSLTGVTLANSGQQASLYVTCNFPDAHAEMLLVNPGGVVEFHPGLILPPNRSSSPAPEQLLH